MAVERNSCQQLKQYDYLLKFLLVGDSDVGKQEILSNLDDGSSESPFCSGNAYKTTTILLDGKRVKLQLWDTSGQGRFCTIIRSYSRGAQGILLVYDITNKWSFDGIDRWLKEVEEHAPGVPKVLVGNRLHLAFKRQVTTREAENYASKNSMAFFEVSPLCDFNITESFSELSRRALHRNGMERLWRSNKVLSLQELCCRSIVARTTVYGIDQLPLPSVIKSHLKSYAMTSYTTVSSPCGMGPGVTVGGCGGPLGSGIGSGGGGGATGCLSAAGQSLSSRVISASYKKSRAGSGASVYHQGSGLVSATVSPCFLPGGGGNQPHHHPPRNSCCIS